MISNESVQYYRNHGFVVVKQMMSVAEIDRIQELVTSLANSASSVTQIGADVYYESTSSGCESNTVRQIENGCSVSMDLFHMAVCGSICINAAAILGGAAVLFKDKVNYKHAGAPGYEPHRDGCFHWRDELGQCHPGWGRYATRYVNAMVAIDRCTTENGCLRVAPGLYQLASFAGLSTATFGEKLDAIPYTPIELERGDVAYFNPLLPHQSAENRTSQCRRIWYLTYNLAIEGDFRELYFHDKRASLRRGATNR